VFLRAFPGYPVDRAPFWAGWFIYGRFAVVVFIVLSGFSLALSPARHGWRLDGLSRFAHRRARRILPAYWAALAFSLAVAWLIAVGVVSAGIVGASTARRSWPWGRLAVAAVTPVAAIIWWRGSVWTLDHLLWIDLALGPAVACLLVGLATGHAARLLPVLDAR